MQKIRSNAIKWWLFLFAPYSSLSNITQQTTFQRFMVTTIVIKRIK
jgi:hypothetical protein